jgi:hypothetical protein
MNHGRRSAASAFFNSLLVDASAEPSRVANLPHRIALIDPVLDERPELGGSTPHIFIPYFLIGNGLVLDFWGEGDVCAIMNVVAVLHLGSPMERPVQS